MWKTKLLFALRNRVDITLEISIGSSVQIALFVAPLLVIASYFIGPSPMAFVLNGLELAAILLAIIIANQVTSEGESNWFEGVQLLAIYLLLALTFWFA